MNIIRSAYSADHAKTSRLSAFGIPVPSPAPSYGRCDRGVIDALNRCGIAGLDPAIHPCRKHQCRNQIQAIDDLPTPPRQQTKDAAA
ncbi:MAG: hypothetical protein J0H25_18520 [Rhizobiales bacterium]|nr:hypothetical protein [Hyphomicrobiales bacterium]